MATEDIKVGISATSTTKVCKENCASLIEGLSTVGTRVDIAHIKASPIGETITATATLKEIDGRRLVFDVTARDSKGEIANGTHERFIIKVDKFLAKIQ